MSVATEPTSREAATALAARIARGETTAAEVCAEALERAAAAPGIVWTLDRGRALADAARIDGRVAAGEEVGPLGGVPVLVKDSFDVASLPTSGGLPWTLHLASTDAPAVAALRRAGAVMIGKTAMDQLAWSMDGEAPGHPPCESPAAPGRRAGGSSAGSAAAVGAAIVPLALGSDSAGSTRVPAAWCDVVGLQVSHGRSDLRGCLPTVPGIDCLGLFADSTADCRLALEAITDGRLPAQRAGGTARLAVLTDAFAGVDDPLVREAFEAALSCLELPDVELSPRDGSIAAPGLGVIFARGFAEAWEGRLTEGPPLPAVAEGIERGVKISPERLAEARASLAAAAQDALRLLGDADAFVLPTTPLLPPPLGADTPLAETSAFTRPFPAFGWAAISIPCGHVRDLPIGLQLACPPGADAILLDLAERLEPALRETEGGR